MMGSEQQRAQIAAGARALIGTTDASLGFTGSANACAFMVNHILKGVFGHVFAGPTPETEGNPNFVPSLRAGLVAGGFRSFTQSANAEKGDIAVQNGLSPGTEANAFENHVGVVIEDPDGGGGLITISNSTSHAAFIHRDDLEFSGIGLPSSKMGPSKFYRFKLPGE